MSDTADIKAMLRHLGCGHNLRDFPGTSTEKLALVRTADARGLIVWTKARSRYELTSIGWNELTPRRRFSMASLMIIAAMGGVVGAAALAVFWSPNDASHPVARHQLLASISQSEMSGVLQASRSTGLGATSSVPLQPVSALPDVLPPIAASPTADETPGSEGTKVADQLAPAPPRAEVAFAGTKQVSVKSSRQKAAHRRRREQSRAWAYARSWREQQYRYAGYGDRGAWLSYR